MGYAVPQRDFKAEVHSAFNTAVNLRLQGNNLLTLVVFAEADLPQGIRLNTPGGFSFAGLQPGDMFTCRGGILRCDSASLSIDLRQARHWKCDLASLAVDVNNPATLAAWQQVEALVRLPLAHTRAVDWNPAAANLMHDSTRGLSGAARQVDVMAAVEHAAALVGLGPGLTPAGDDYLVGFMAGLWSSAGPLVKRQQFITSLGKVLTRQSRKTNDISRTYLVHAAGGQVSSRLAELAEAIQQGQGFERLNEFAKAVIQVGHTSGLEAAAGLLAGLAAWARDIPTGQAAGE